MYRQEIIYTKPFLIQSLLLKFVNWVFPMSVMIMREVAIIAQNNLVQLKTKLFIYVYVKNIFYDIFFSWFLILLS